MAYKAEVIADSISPQGHRLTTMLVTYPRFVHSEHLRHRSFSYSVASSRALPIQKMIDQVLDDPVVPVYWGKNQKGMIAEEELTDRQRRKAERLWLEARDQAVVAARQMADFDVNDPEAPPEDRGVGVHKQVTNRLLEPWMWVTVLVTGTEWENFWWLRCHPAAQPEMRRAAELMRAAYEASVPNPLGAGQWHLPFIRQEDRDECWSRQLFDGRRRVQTIWNALKKISAGRCARTSYLTHLGVRDISEDIRLHDQLRGVAEGDPPHLSPLEHQATPLDEGSYVTIEDARAIVAGRSRTGVADEDDAVWLARHLNSRANLVGWQSYRFTIPGEDGRR